MPDAVDIRDLPFSWTIAVVIIVVAAVAFGIGGYLIATRRIRQPFAVFLARYGIAFALLFLLEYALLSLVPSFHDSMRNLTATLVSGMLSLAGVGSTVSGPILDLEDSPLAFDIDVACLGGILLWAYAALVLAELKASTRQRLVGIFVGLAIVVGFNIFRIVTSIYVEWLTGVHVHDIFFIVNMGFVLLVWAGWLRTLKSRRGTASQAEP